MSKLKLYVGTEQEKIIETGYGRIGELSIKDLAFLSGAWILYNEDDFMGACALYAEKGKQMTKREISTDVKFDENRIRSARPLPAAGIILFEKERYQGKCWQTTALSKYEWSMNFGVRSAIVVSGEYELFLETDFKGRAFTVSENDEDYGFFSNLVKTTHGRIRSFKEKGLDVSDRVGIRLSEDHTEAIERKRWEQLADEISRSPREVTEYAKEHGCLYIIGSGLQVGQFTMEAVSLIKAADKVFYCIADAPGEQFIQSIRPDAMDMYVFYNDSKVRYHTYVQMAETLLYYVRKGFNVVGVFYGHPGVFVDPSHRALNIALREGFKAKMLPAVSALDCLFADLDIDPAFPGLQTFEVTDMMLRKREIHIDQHVVLWQVGCVLDTGYRRRGYLNHNLNILLDYLISYYGPEYEVVNYIAAVFCVSEPIIERYQLQDLYDPKNAARVSGLSTWYLAPKVVRKPNVELYKKLKLKVPEKPFTRESRYYYREDEIAALKELENFKVPVDYKKTVSTEAGSMMINMCHDGKQYFAYKKNRTKFIAGLHISDKAKAAIQSDVSWRIRKLTKPAVMDVISDFVQSLYSQPALMREWVDVLYKYGTESDGEPDVNAWLKDKGYDTTIADIQNNRENFFGANLITWTGVYDLNFDDAELIIVGDVTTAKSRLYYNAVLVKKYQYADSMIKFSSGDGNAVNAELTLCAEDTGDDIAKRITGKIWYASQSKPEQDNVSGEAEPIGSPIGIWHGSYKTSMQQNGQWVVGNVLEIDGKNNAVYYGGSQIENFKYDNAVLTWEKSKQNTCNATITFTLDSGANAKSTKSYIPGFYGKCWEDGEEPDAVNYSGKKDVTDLSDWGGFCYTEISTEEKNAVSVGKELIIQCGSGDPKVFYGGIEIKNYHYGVSELMWDSGDGNGESVDIKFYGTDTPYFVGTITNAGESQCKFLGYYDTKYLSEWSGYYTSTVMQDGKAIQTPEVIICGGLPGEDSTLYVSDAQIKNVAFNNPVISWSEADNETNGEITVHCSTTTNKKEFYGYYWGKGQTKPTTFNWYGTADTTYLLSWNGWYYTYCRENENGKWKTGYGFQVIGGKTNESSAIKFNGEEINNWVYDSGKLTWTEAANQTNGEIQFYIPKPTSDKTTITPGFNGFIWDKGTEKPSYVNYYGTETPPIYESEYKTPWYLQLMQIVGCVTNVYFVLDLICQFWKGKPLASTIRDYITNRVEPRIQEESAIDPSDNEEFDFPEEPSDPPEMQQTEEQETEEQQTEEQQTEEQQTEEQQTEEQQVEEQQVEETEVTETEVTETEVVETEVVEAEVVEAEVVEVEIIAV